MNENQRTKFGDIFFKDIESTFKDTYIIEGNVDDYIRFDFYLGKYGGYRNYVLSNLLIDNLLAEKGIDMNHGISADSFLHMMQDVKPNSIA